MNICRVCSGMFELKKVPSPSNLESMKTNSRDAIFAFPYVFVLLSTARNRNCYKRIATPHIPLPIIKNEK